MTGRQAAAGECNVTATVGFSQKGFWGFELTLWVLGCFAQSTSGVLGG